MSMLFWETSGTVIFCALDSVFGYLKQKCEFGHDSVKDLSKQPIRAQSFPTHKT